MTTHRQDTFIAALPLVTIAGFSVAAASNHNCGEGPFFDGFVDTGCKKRS